MSLNVIKIKADIHVKLSKTALWNVPHRDQGQLRIINVCSTFFLNILLNVLCVFQFVVI